ncbi:MAG: glycine-rich protein, partial [Lentisphaerota bacterium]
MMFSALNNEREIRSTNKMFSGRGKISFKAAIKCSLNDLPGVFEERKRIPAEIQISRPPIQINGSTILRRALPTSKEYWVGAVARTSVNITLNPPAAPTGITASPTFICPGSSAALSANTVIGTIQWYDAATGGNFLGSTVSGGGLVVSPTATTTYWAQDSAACGFSTRVSVTITSGSLAVPTSISATPSSVSCGGASAISGTTPGQFVAWYDSPTGGNFLGNTPSGGSITVNPVGTTTYYAESQNGTYGSITYGYTGGQQTFSVPGGVSSINFDVSGAKGGTYNSAYGTGGLGGRVSGTLAVNPSQVIYLYVGQMGAFSASSPYGAGYNGGGAGGYGTYFGSGGGGASDIRIGGTNFANRIVVAAGGGGAGGYSSYTGINGGWGGDLIGGMGCYLYGSNYWYYSGQGGTQIAGGIVN